MPSILPEMLRAAIHGTPFHLAKGGDHRFQFVHAEDVPRAAYAAATATELMQRVYNISGGRQITARETADIILGQFPQSGVARRPRIHRHAGSTGSVGLERSRRRPPLSPAVDARGRDPRLCGVADNASPLTTASLLVPDAGQPQRVLSRRARRARRARRVRRFRSQDLYAAGDVLHKTSTIARQQCDHQYRRATAAPVSARRRQKESDHEHHSACLR